MARYQSAQRDSVAAVVRSKHDLRLNYYLRLDPPTLPSTVLSVGYLLYLVCCKVVLFFFNDVIVYMH